ncbi:ectoine/hydroxyectoine ABC transporter substrate-binding protein EhuB [Quisquiliibacterium transsilvanicum]|uniref:Polar amino acid transport system substrate-binding protein n=1 Tax=Quisquiliibacterium transsilvanicum TaxID=1549638 RepID=A0A7W8HK04_9BURK|nr:ectoine/hydroxyectoine ABC transporter substrate-binding protein EhuB [Quisquiliibacterium transsilvanicum]MBB5273363.1 polar amino acid transport system substrate-binding protein [Quisquiliibacterium transsilvanicum]
MSTRFGTRRGLLALLGVGVLAPAGFARAATTLDRIRESGVIRVGFANEAPYAYATAGGELTGESPTVFRHVMKRLGVARVDGVLTEWGALIPGLKAGRFDAIVASMYITPRRCRQILFANPTYGIGEALVVPAGNPEGLRDYADAVAKEAKVAFVAGTAEIEHARMAGLSRGQQLIVPDFASAFAAVKAGRASAAALTALTAGVLAQKDEAVERAEPFTFVHEGRSYRGEGSFGFRPEDTALRDAVNEELAGLIGTEEHLAMVAEFGFDATNLPEKTAEQHCAGE